MKRMQSRRQRMEIKLLELQIQFCHLILFSLVQDSGWILLENIAKNHPCIQGKVSEIVTELISVFQKISRFSVTRKIKGGDLVYKCILLTT